MEHLPSKREDSIFPLITQALDNKVSVDVLERLFDLQQRVKAQDAAEQFNEALIYFQENCPIIERKKPVRNKSGRIMYFYAPLEHIIVQVKPLLKVCNFSYAWEASMSNDDYTAICNLYHIAGHSRSSPCTLPMLPGITSRDGASVINETQRGSGTITMCKRNSFINVLGITSADPDTDGRDIEEEAVEKEKAALIANIESLITEKGLDRQKQLRNMKVESFDQQNVDTLTKYHQWLMKVRPVTQMKVGE